MQQSIHSTIVYTFSEHCVVNVPVLRPFSICLSVCLSVSVCQSFCLKRASSTSKRRFLHSLFIPPDRTGICLGCEKKKLSYCWDSSRYNKISDSNRSAIYLKYDLCNFYFTNRDVNIRVILYPIMMCQLTR